MLKSKSTKNGTGVEFCGDYNDLYCLHNVFYKLKIKSNPDDIASFERNERLLTIIPSEIRHAYEGKYVSYDIDNGRKGTTTYYGFRINWITLLYSLAVLRYNAAHIPTDKETQGYLYLIEHLTQKSAFEYDIIGAQILEKYIGKNIYVEGNYTYLVQHYLALNFFKQKKGKVRFRAIPSMLNSMHIMSSNYNIVIKELCEKAEQIQCKIDDVPIIW